jgi:ketosteroid isomerase-like protein
MKRSIVLATSLMSLSALSIAGCTARQETPLPASVTTALESAFNKGDIQACVDVYADDAEIIAEDAPAVRGKLAIERFFNEQVAREISFDTDSSVSIVSGNVAIEQGTYRVRNVARGVDVESGDYLNVWRKTNGEWKAYRSMYNVTMSPNAAVSVTQDAEPDERML